MIPAAELLYDIDFKLNKVATSWYQNIPLEDKLIAINEAQFVLIKKKMDSAATGFDADKKVYDDLQQLVVPYTRMQAVKDTTAGTASYYSNLSELPTSYLYFVDAYFLCNKGNCQNRKVRGYRIKHADLQLHLNNANTCPSFEYQETPVTVTADRLYVFTDNTFSVAASFLSYIRHPVSVDVEGYINFQGQPSINRDAELSAHLKDELIDIAIRQLAMSTENATATQYAQARIQQP